MNKLLSKIGYVISTHVVSQTAQFVIRILLTRLLSIHDFGLFSILLLWGNFISQVIGFGTGKLLTKEISKNQIPGQGPQFQNITIWSFGVIIGISLMISLALLISQQWLVSLTGIPFEFQLFVLLLAFSIAIYDWHFSIYNGLDKAVKGRILQFVMIPLSLITLLLTYWHHNHDVGDISQILNGYTAIYSFATIIGIIFSLRIAGVYFNLKWYKEWPVRRWFNFSSLNFLSIFLQTILSRLDLIFISIFMSNQEFGLYVVAAGIFTTLTFVNYAFAMILEPKISVFYSGGQIRRLLPFLRKNITYQTIIVILIYSGILLLGKQVLGLFGSQYASMSSILNVICLVSFTQAITGPSSVLLIMTGKLKERVAASIIPILIGIISFPYIIGLHGLMGVAIVYSIIQLIHRMLLTYYAHKKLDFNFFFSA